MRETSSTIFYRMKNNFNDKLKVLSPIHVLRSMLQETKQKIQDNHEKIIEKFSRILKITSLINHNHIFKGAAQINGKNSIEHWYDENKEIIFLDIYYSRISELIDSFDSNHEIKQSVRKSFGSSEKTMDKFNHIFHLCENYIQESQNILNLQLDLESDQKEQIGSTNYAIYQIMSLKWYVELAFKGQMSNHSNLKEDEKKTHHILKAILKYIDDFSMFFKEKTKQNSETCNLFPQIYQYMTRVDIKKIMDAFFFEWETWQIIVSMERSNFIKSLNQYRLRYPHDQKYNNLLYMVNKRINVDERILDVSQNVLVEKCYKIDEKIKNRLINTFENMFQSKNTNMNFNNQKCTDQRRNVFTSIFGIVDEEFEYFKKIYKYVKKVIRFNKMMNQNVKQGM